MKDKPQIIPIQGQHDESAIDMELQDEMIQDELEMFKATGFFDE